jgi:hypothetical protein
MRNGNRAAAALATVLAAIGAAGCAAQSRAPAGPRTVSIDVVNGPYLLAGTVFDAQIEHAIGADSSNVGDPFVARVSSPLNDRRGRTVVDGGAIVHGRIAAVDRDGGIGVKIESIHTVNGEAPLHATIQAVPGHAYPAVAQATPSYDVLLRPERPSAIGGGPPEAPRPPDEEVPRTVEIPTRSTAQLVLLENLVPPGVGVFPPSPYVLQQRRRWWFPGAEVLQDGRRWAY